MLESQLGEHELTHNDIKVRGTTSKEIVTMAREAGAVKVYFASCAPPLVYPHIVCSPSNL